MRISNFSKWLVLLQFLLLLFIVYQSGWYPQHSGWQLLYAAGWMVAIAAAFAFRHSYLSIFPEPAQKSVLITHGIYRFIRHPFYTAVLCISLALVADSGQFFPGVAWLLLLLVLLAKIEFEEKLLVKIFDDYLQYRLYSRKLIPFLY